VDSRKAPPELVLHGVGFKLYRESELTTIGHAQSASFRSDSGDGSAQKVRLRFLGMQEGDVLLETGRASGNVRERQADAEGEVWIADGNGTVARTERAHIDGVSRLASGIDPVDVTGASFRSRAESGFTLELDGSRRLAFQGPVTSKVRDMKGMP
jgi:hypothetical protein